MKRDLKFRVWNGVEMVYDVMVGRFGVFYVNPSNGGLDEKDSASLTTYNTKYPANIPVMQYAGLRDKNGVEIYEGDIIKFKTTRFHTEKQRLAKTAKSKWFISPVLWSEGSFVINEKTKITLDADDYDTGLVCLFHPRENGDFEPKVIGNIYENPELLQDVV